MKPCAVTLVVAVLSLGLCVSVTWAWWPLAHSLLGVDSGLEISPGYHQAADTWESWDPNGWGYKGVMDEFCWSHVCPRTDWYYIVRPWYYDYGIKYQDNDPAEHMRVLIEKLLPEHRVLPKMEEFRKGFAAHNAGDQGGVGGKHTHFDLAPCADAWYHIYRWWYHARVETAIESVAYVAICYGNDANVAFDPNNGNPVGLPGPYAGIIGSSGGDTDTDGLLCLAMKVFRKKQQTVDLDPGELKGLTPLSRTTIGQKRAANIKTSAGGLLTFNRDQWEADRHMLYEDPIWPEAPLWREYYDAAKQAASGVQ